jgi:hypothetical protein
MVIIAAGSAMGEHLCMSPSSRRLTFIVGTSLLTASLATGCKKGEPTVNPGPEEAPHVNTAAPDEPAPEETAPEETAPEETPEETPDAPE